MKPKTVKLWTSLSYIFSLLLIVLCLQACVTAATPQGKQPAPAAPANTAAGIAKNELPDLPEKDMITQQEYGQWIANKGVCLKAYNDQNRSSGSNTVILLQNDADVVNLIGWAVDFWNNAPLKELYLKVGDTVFPCEYGTDRPDVVNWYENENMRYTGFYVEFSADYLRDGENGFYDELSFIGVSSDGTCRYSPATYLLHSYETVDLPDLPEKDMITKQEYGQWIANKGVCLNSFNGEKRASGSDTEIFLTKTETQLLFTGWAADFWNNAPLRELYIQAGNYIFRCNYGIERQDIVDWFDNEALLKTGFQVELPTDVLNSTSLEEFSFIGISSDGQYRYSPAFYLLHFYETADLPDLPEKDMITKQEYGQWIANKGVCLNSFNGEKRASGSDTEIFLTKTETQLLFTGWAADFWNNAPLRELYIQAGNYIFRCNYGIERQDIVDWFDNEALLKTGFQVELPTNVLNSTSLEEFSFIGISSDGQYRYSPASYHLNFQ